ncbi:MAG TPA: DNA replication/repair protein RecF [Dehalococcoidia bacterium]|nr:DNA replication/repair protein RecF [Dehalococcoidia bacterium]
MYLRRLQLTAFRNYLQLDLSLPRGNLLFLGANAQGKSNLLEAVYLLANGRSGRAASEAEMISWEAEADPQPVARVTGAVERRTGSLQLEVIIAGPSPKTGARAGKRLRVNGIPRRAADFVGNLRAVQFTAEDMAIITGPPSERRRFLDEMLSQLDRRYYTAGQQYARVLQQRNAVLKRIKEGIGAPDELDFWDDRLVQEGAIIVQARARACASLAALAAAFHRDLSGDAMEALDLEYWPRLAADESWRPEAPAGLEDFQAMLAGGLQRARRREIAAGMSLVGPHRDEVALRINGASAGSFGSRAQVRTATLSLRLAEARILERDITDPPVLLLDDIVSELDEARRRSVLATIADFDQVWFTATDTHGFDPGFMAAAITFRVDAGTISA